MVNTCCYFYKQGTLLLSPVVTFINENYILFALSIAVVFSLTWPLAGQRVASLHVGKLEIIQLACYVIVFFISGLTLKTEELQSIWESRFLVLYGITTINFITTLAAFVTRLLPFYTEEFALGMKASSTHIS